MKEENYKSQHFANTSFLNKQIKMLTPTEEKEEQVPKLLI